MCHAFALHIIIVIIIVRFVFLLLLYFLLSNVMRKGTEL